MVKSTSSLDTSTKPNYQIRLSDGIADPNWDAFLAETPGGHHVQTRLWAQVKVLLGWQILRVIVHRGNQIVAGAQILIRPLPLIGAIGFIPKGPVFALNDPELTNLVIDQIVKLVRSRRIYYLILQPPDNGEAFAMQLSDWKFRPSPISAFPTATVQVDLSEELDDILAKMKPKTRYNIRLGLRKGMTVREGTEHDLPTFYRILISTSQRQNFATKFEAYYAEMNRVFSPYGYFKLFLAEYQGETVSAMFAIPFGDTVLFKRGGWNGQHGNLRPNEVMHWTALKWAKSQGYRYYNFEGIDLLVAKALLRGEPLPNDLLQSVSRFKLGFGGQIVLLPGVYDYVYNPLLRRIYHTLYLKMANWSITEKVMSRLGNN